MFKRAERFSRLVGRQSSEGGATVACAVAMPLLVLALAVGADYGLTVIKGAPAAAEQFSRFILSPAGQNILIGYGFAPGQTAPSQTER